jgi:hypothetical protein
LLFFFFWFGSYWDTLEKTRTIKCFWQKAEDVIYASQKVQSTLPQLILPNVLYWV